VPLRGRGVGELGSHVTHCGMARGLYTFAPSGIDPTGLATTDMGRKLGGYALFGVGAGSPSSTMWPGLRPTSIPSGILIHPPVWPQ